MSNPVITTNSIKDNETSEPHNFYLFMEREGKVTRLSAINTLEEGGIKIIDMESMIKALRLAWLKRIFNNNDSTWKFYVILARKKTWRSFNL